MGKECYLPMGPLPMTGFPLPLPLPFPLGGCAAASR